MDRWINIYMNIYMDIDMTSGRGEDVMRYRERRSGWSESLYTHAERGREREREGERERERERESERE